MHQQPSATSSSRKKKEAPEIIVLSGSEEDNDASTESLKESHKKRVIVDAIEHVGSTEHEKGAPSPITNDNEDDVDEGIDKQQEDTLANKEPTTMDLDTSKSAVSLSANPFAQFAASASATNPPLPSKRHVDIAQWISSSSNKNHPPQKKKQRNSNQSSESNKWVRMKELSGSEQARIVDKWHSMVVADSDSSDDDNKANMSTMQDRRFQIFVAARLHARCQEGPVRQALKALHRRLCPEYGPKLSVSLLASTDPDLWQDSINNLQYYATKARQIHKASNEILNQFSGIVPENEADLKRITGIGPVFADLLAFVNTTELHQSRQGQQGD